ncbi:MAG: acetylglutamate kinase [Candidatus Baltobacteraceae bacterium]
MLILVKYGGNAMPGASEPDPVLRELAGRVRDGDAVVLVHGGGPQIDAELRARGIVTERIAGQRVTSAATLGVTEAVLCGTVNKSIVRALLGLDVAAVGICGQDGGLLRATRGEPALGYVGGIARVEAGPVRALLAAGYVPVVAPLGYDAADGTALNVNADTAAGALAGALRVDVYLNVTNVERVRLRVDDRSSAVAVLRAAKIRAGFLDGAFEGGMRPKLESAVSALEGGARRAIVAAWGPGVLAGALGGAGTEIFL